MTVNPRQSFKLKLCISIFAVATITFLIVITFISINRIAKPLENFAEAARQISHGDFHVKLPVIRDRNELYDLRQAPDEALSNTVNYAYGEGTGKIELEASKDGENITFRLIDSGAPFDPTNEGEDVDITSSAEQRLIGGLGIYLIKQMMDEVSYERQDNQNILIMKKKI